MFNDWTLSKTSASKRRRKQRRPNLSVDTTCIRHKASPPQQLYSEYAATNTDQVANQSNALHTHNKNTPMIIITPAREDFDLPDLTDHQPRQRRAPSSVYSRATDYLPRSRRFSSTPPLPFLLPTIGRGRNDTHDEAQDLNLRRPQAMSTCTEFEEDTASNASPRMGRAAIGRITTPRRSEGWWNIIKSPFSAKSNFSMWRSPMLDERTPILRGDRRLSLDSDEEALRSASAYQDRPTVEHSAPHRSVTAPIIMSTGDDSINIYRIPSQGEAAPYYDLERHFPSLIVSPSQARSMFDDNTPITACDSGRSPPDERAVVPIPMTCSPNPFLDEHITPQHSRALFSTPSADELKTPVPMPRMPEHSPTTLQSQFSPLSPSPILGKAHIAQVIGEVKGEQKEVDVLPPRQTPPPPQGLAAATMASRSLEAATWKDLKAAPSRPYNHSRSSSYGLGITGSEPELHPAAAEVEEKQAWRSESRHTQARPPWWRRYLWMLLALGFGLVTLAIILMVMHMPQRHNDISVQAQWVNLTGYPALPIGILTVAQPKAVRKDDGCVSPSGLWSCAISADQRRNGTELPNFRFEIRFRNDSSLNNTLVQSNLQEGSAGDAATATSSLQRTRTLRRDAWSDSLFMAKPEPPSDQVFLGNTTDNNTLPYDGEATPFYISLINADALALHKRQASVYPYPNADNSTDGSTSQAAPNSIPKPVINSDGSPMPEMLSPLVEAQPLRLYKRQRSDEHYSFYTYYDRTVYVANSSDGSIISNVPLANASAVCTWSQSRLLVQIWTRSLIPSTSISNSNHDPAAMNSTANDLSFPGSFPYAVTVTIDRHGGDAALKGVYCYGIGANQKVEQTVMSWIAEDRAHGGTIVNPANVPTNTGTLSRRDVNAATGTDGGTGGCACAWQNW